MFCTHPSVTVASEGIRHLGSCSESLQTPYQSKKTSPKKLLRFRSSKWLKLINCLLKCLRSLSAKPLTFFLVGYVSMEISAAGCETSHWCVLTASRKHDLEITLCDHWRRAPRGAGERSRLVRDFSYLSLRLAVSFSFLSFLNTHPWIFFFVL